MWPALSSHLGLWVFPRQSFFTAFLPFSLGAVYLQLTEKQRGCSRYLPSHYLRARGRRHCHLCFLPHTPIICYCVSYSKLLHCFISGIVYPACQHGAFNPDFLECCTLILHRCSMIAQPQLFLSTPGWITAWSFPLLMWESWPWSPISSLSSTGFHLAGTGQHLGFSSPAYFPPFSFLLAFFGQFSQAQGVIFGGLLSRRWWWCLRVPSNSGHSVSFFPSLYFSPGSCSLLSFLALL